jgi:hypothetical protein
MIAVITKYTTNKVTGARVVLWQMRQSFEHPDELSYRLSELGYTISYKDAYEDLSLPEVYYNIPAGEVYEN